MSCRRFSFNPTSVLAMDSDIEIHDKDGERWVTVKQLGEAIGYSSHRPLVNLVNRNPQDFQGHSCIIKMMTREESREVQREMMVLNFDGVLLAMVYANTQKAIHRQSDRRNLTDGAILTCVEVLDKRKAITRDEKTGIFTEASDEATGKSAKHTGEMLSISPRKVERIRTDINHGTEATGA